MLEVLHLHSEQNNWKGKSDWIKIVDSFLG